MNKQAVEVIEKKKEKPAQITPPNSTGNSKGKEIKCSIENSGKCRSKTCNYSHPTKTCQSHSKLGSCPTESSCEHRHPQRICFDLERQGSCYRGDQCRYRHPLELQEARPKIQKDSFLGRRESSLRHPTHQRRRKQNTDSHIPQGWNHQNHQGLSLTRNWTAPENIRHHDLRGSRW